MRNRTLLLLCVAVAVNVALALLPMYDPSNIRNWTALGSLLRLRRRLWLIMFGQAVFSLLWLLRRCI